MKAGSGLLIVLLLQLSDVTSGLTLQQFLWPFLIIQQEDYPKSLCSSRHHAIFKEEKKGEAGHSDPLYPPLSPILLLSEKQKLSKCITAPHGLSQMQRRLRKCVFNEQKQARERIGQTHWCISPIWAIRADGFQYSCLVDLLTMNS